jgi:Transposase DNA-binding/Transposase DDE domain
MNEAVSSVGSVIECPFLRDLAVGDARLTQRLNLVLDRLEVDPSRSFPMMFDQEKELDAFYRLMNNPRLKSESFIQASLAAAVQKIMSTEIETTVLAIHDTTQFEFASLSQLSGKGRLTSRKKGFLGHFCIAAKMNQEILGVLDLKTWCRPDRIKGKRNRHTIRRDPTCESLRWREAVETVHASLPQDENVVHVMDREADDYSLLSLLVNNGMRFVIRANYDRKLIGETKCKLHKGLRKASIRCERELFIRSRKYKPETAFKQKTRHPERKQRLARLGISGQSFEICRGSHARQNQTPESLLLNFVRVIEIDPPKGERPVEWMLVTSEPIDSDEDLLRIVEIYKSRWLIEEYFKALKSGCSMEERGFESIEALYLCVSIFAAIACQIYNLKTMGRIDPQASSGTVVNEIQIQILSQLTGYSADQLRTTESVMYAVAKAGGHLRRNGLPGWQILYRGFEKLLLLEKGWILAQSSNSKGG